MQSILLVLALLLLNGPLTSAVTQVLLRLNFAYKADLNIFVNLGDVSKNTLDLQQLETPAIHIQTSIETFNSFRLLGSFTRNTLIIVHIETPPVDPSVGHLLPYLLTELHELHIVFITKEDPSIWQEDLYRFCFREGFINMLLINYHNNTQLLYSYNPYPTIQALKMNTIDDYLNREQQLHNFHQFPIRTIPDTLEPRKFRYVNRQGETIHAGYIYNAFLEFIRRHNATLEFSDSMPVNGAFLKAFDMISSKEVDFVCYPKEITWKVSSTTTLHLLKSYVIVPHARPIASYLYFARPFTWNLWIAVISTVGYGMVMLYASYGSNRSEFGLHFLSSWCHLLFLPQPMISICNWQQFAIHFVLILSGFVLTNLYLALLSSMLTSGLFEPQFNTLQDLIYSPYPMLVDDYYVNYLKHTAFLPAEVISRLTCESPINLNTARVGLNTSYIYSSYEDRIESILYQQHLLKVPRFKMIPESIMDGLMAMPVAPSLPYLNMLNMYLRRIFDYGILAKMKSDAWRDGIDSGIYKLMRNEGVEQKPYNLEFYFFAFVLWAVGLTLSAMCFLLELLMCRKA